MQFSEYMAFILFAETSSARIQMFIFIEKSKPRQPDETLGEYWIIS